MQTQVQQLEVKNFALKSCIQLTRNICKVTHTVSDGLKLKILKVSCGVCKQTKVMFTFSVSHQCILEL